MNQTHVRLADVDRYLDNLPVFGGAAAAPVLPDDGRSRRLGYVVGIGCGTFVVAALRAGLHGATAIIPIALMVSLIAMSWVVPLAGEPTAGRSGAGARARASQANARREVC